MWRVILLSMILGFQPASSLPALTSQQQTTVDEGEYTCAMHPEIRSKTKGKCPKCAMPLISVSPAVVDDFTLKMDVEPKQLKANENVKFRFSIFNPKTNEQVKEFSPLHDRLFHLFIISQDLSEFQHIHPAFNQDGSFTIETRLPKPGRYKIYCDFYPNDGNPQVLQQNIVTTGFSDDLFAGTPKITPDESLTKVVDGVKILKEDASNLGVVFTELVHKEVNPLKVELKVDGEKIIAGKQTALKYHLTDAKTGEPIHDLSPYLGAWGHTLILSEDQTDYVHSHPSELPPDPFSAEIKDESAFLGGPDITFEALFPREGNFRIWTQFLRGDEMMLVIFNVRAERLR